MLSDSSIATARGSRPGLRGRALARGRQPYGRDRATRFPVVERNEPHKLLGTISLNDLLHARVLNLDGERRREHVLQIPRVTSVPKVRMRVYGNTAWPVGRRGAQLYRV